MKLLIEIRDEKKVPFIMEFLESQPYIKAKTVARTKAKLKEDLKEAFEEVNLYRQGKIKLKTAQQLSDEL